jgi:uncharacterized membrane protein
MSKSSEALAIPQARLRGTRLDGALRLSAWVERQAPRLLVAAMAAYVLILFAASVYKYEHFGQGYDQVDFEQALWNTVHGRPFADSRFNFTDSIFGMDWMPLLAVFVPVYALLPSALPLFFLQILAAALGAWPVYLLARDKLGTRRHGLVFGLAWLLYPTIQYSVLDPFQIRIFATTLLLFALLYFERDRMIPFLITAGLALLARTDVALVVLMFGVYALVARRGARWVIAPLLLGGGYFLLVMTFIVPAFVHLPEVHCTGPIPPEQIATAWPGSNNPNLGYYLHWGCTPGMILTNLVKNPLYTLNYMFGDPRKWAYLAALLAPFAFLALLNPGRLLLGLPVLGLNLIAWRGAQINYRTHYQLLITIGVVGAAIAGYAVLERLIGRQRRLDPAAEITPAGMEARPDPTAGDVAAATRNLLIWRDGPLLAVLVVALVVNILLVNPVISIVRYPEPAARVAAAERLIAMVPPTAQVAASSKLAPRLLPRQYIYNFPPAPYSPYNMHDFKGLNFILVDENASALNELPLGSDVSALKALDSSPEWILVTEDHDFRLYARKHR